MSCLKEIVKRTEELARELNERADAHRLEAACTGVINAYEALPFDQQYGTAKEAHEAAISLRKRAQDFIATQSRLKRESAL